MLSMLRRTSLAVLLTLSAAASALGGEWHSAGNSPTPPYYPHSPANYSCHVTVTTGVGAEMYRVERDVNFDSSTFSANTGTGSFVLDGETDPLMNGQSFNLSFRPDGRGGESVVLRLISLIKDASGTLSSYNTATSPRSAGSISGQSTVESSPKRGTARSVEVEVNCSETKGT